MTVPRRLAGLDEKLAAYTSMIGTNGSASSGASGWSRWPVYAAAVGSSFALASAADASSITYSGLQNITRQIEGHGPGFFSSDITLQFAGSGLGSGFSMRARYFRGTIAGVNRTSGFAVLSATTQGSHVMLRNGSGNLRRLAFGAMISNGAGTFDPLRATLKGQVRSGSGIASLGEWPANATGFAGVRGSTGSGGVNFGWIRLKWTDDIFNPDNIPGMPDSVTVIDWAMDTTGQSIRAGDTGITAEAVPEPGSLALLATGAAGLLALRRRRQQKEQVKSQV